MACLLLPFLRPHVQVSALGLDLEMPRFTVKNECMSLSSVSLRVCVCAAASHWVRQAAQRSGGPVDNLFCVQRSGGTLCNPVVWMIKGFGARA